MQVWQSVTGEDGWTLLHSDKVPMQYKRLTQVMAPLSRVSVCGSVMFGD